MELRRWIQVLCILSALQDFLDFRVYSLQCPNSHYSTDQGGQERCCVECKKGERVERHCLVGRNNSTKCKACEEGTYQDTPNGETSCRRCARQEKQYRKILKPCTRFNNKEYGDCYEGYFHDAVLDACKKCRKCAKGYGVKTECTKESDTSCEENKCGMGTYSDEESLTQKCTKCTACESGEEMYKECTPSSNYECRPKVSPTRKETTNKTTTIQIKTTTTPKSPIPTHASREKDQSWVMPFFIAAMVIVLILSLALIIGVTIWCHIQSKNRQHNVIVQAEDPQVVQRLTKLMEEEESVCIPNDESRYRFLDVPIKKPGIQENGLLLRDVSHNIIEELANYLNPISPPSNWRKVASMMDFPWNVINNLALCPTTATQQLLQRWGTKRDSTVYKLYLILKDIGRDDAAGVLERLLVQSVPSCPKSI